MLIFSINVHYSYKFLPLRVDSLDFHFSEVKTCVTLKENILIYQMTLSLYSETRIKMVHNRTNNHNPFELTRFLRQATTTYLVLDFYLNSDC